MRAGSDGGGGVNADEKRLAWLKERQKGIGGSEAPALILAPDLYKWQRPYDVFLCKTSPADDKPASLPCRTGNALEHLIAELFTEATGIKVHRVSQPYVNAKYPFMRGNIDRKIWNRNIGLECKSTSAFNAKRFTDEDFPLEYFVQMQHYMAVTGWDKWYLACLIGNNSFKWYEAHRNEDIISLLIERETEFWNMVQNNNYTWEER